MSCNYLHQLVSYIVSIRHSSGGRQRLPVINHLTSGKPRKKSLKIPKDTNRAGGVMVGVIASSAVDRGFEARSGQTKDYKIGIICFSAKHAAFIG